MRFRVFFRLSFSTLEGEVFKCNVSLCVCPRLPQSLSLFFFLCFVVLQTGGKKERDFVLRWMHGGKYALQNVLVLGPHSCQATGGDEVFSSFQGATASGSAEELERVSDDQTSSFSLSFSLLESIR